MRVRFGRFTLDSGTRQLIRDGLEVRLSPKAFDLLSILVERRPAVVDKRDLHDRLWPGTFVVDTNLSVLIGEVRRALGETPHDSRCIRTVHKVGYAFCAEATGDTSSPSAPASEGARCWLTAQDRTFVLVAGENVIGRTPDCHVWVDASGVSRRHARIQVTADGGHASIEDLESTNGTFVRGSRVAGRTALADGDVIEIGPVSLTVRMWAAEGGRKTERIGRGRRPE